MDKNLLILALAVIVVVGAVGGYVLLQAMGVTSSFTQVSLPEETSREGPKPKVVFPFSQSPIQEFTVTGTEFAFSPREITVKAGQPVRITFVNGGTAGHNFVIPDLDVGTKVIEPGQSETIQFTVSEGGTFPLRIICSVPGHEEAGMVGSLNVE